MKSLLALFIFTVLIPGCGTLECAAKYSGPTYIAPELREVMDDWVTTCKQHLDPARCDTAGIENIVRVERFKDERTLGMCEVRWRGFEEVRRVFIHKDIPLDGYFIRAIVLHEMMHCRMGFERHADVGLMGEEMLYSERTLPGKWAELVEETYSLVK